jgi:tellurite resistance protein
MPSSDRAIIDRIVKGIARPTDERLKASILTKAGELYGSRPLLEEHTPPTGFDPRAAALFEVLVEGAFLVANADGQFDDEERHAFETIVYEAAHEEVKPEMLSALLADLKEQLQQDGPDKRIQVIARLLDREEHRREVLRVAALVAQVSGGVSEVEEKAMRTMAAAFGLDDAAVDAATKEARTALECT